MLVVTRQLLFLSRPVLATSPDRETQDQAQDHEIQAKVTTTAPGPRHSQPTVCECRAPCLHSTQVDEEGPEVRRHPACSAPAPPPTWRVRDSLHSLTDQ